MRNYDKLFDEAYNLLEGAINGKITLEKPQLEAIQEALYQITRSLDEYADRFEAIDTFTEQCDEEDEEEEEDE